MELRGPRSAKVTLKMRTGGGSPQTEMHANPQESDGQPRAALDSRARPAGSSSKVLAPQCGEGRARGRRRGQGEGATAARKTLQRLLKAQSAPAT